MEDEQVIHEIIMIMNDNQYRGGKDSNKKELKILND